MGIEWGLNIWVDNPQLITRIVELVSISLQHFFVMMMGT